MLKDCPHVEISPTLPPAAKLVNLLKLNRVYVVSLFTNEEKPFFVEVLTLHLHPIGKENHLLENNFSFLDHLSRKCLCDWLKIEKLSH